MNQLKLEMEDKKWYWESLNMICKEQIEKSLWTDEFRTFKRSNSIKLVHKKLQTKDAAFYNIKVSEHPFSINNEYYDLELCGNIEIITNLIKEKIRDIKLSKIGIK